MKILLVLLLTFVIGLVLNYLFELLVYRSKAKSQIEEGNKEDFGVMERGVNDGCQTTIRLVLFCLVGLVFSLWLTESIMK